MSQVITGQSNLYTWCLQNGEYGQQLLSEWTGLDENGKLVDIHTIGKGSVRKMQWHCSRCGNIWVSTNNLRTSNKGKCKICSNALKSQKAIERYLKSGKTDLYTWCQCNGEFGKQLLSEWTGLDENNNPIDIHNLYYNSKTKIKWRCKRDHEWIAAVYGRTTKKTGCRLCSHSGTSYPEQFIYWSLKQIFPNAENRCRVLKSPEHPQGIEFDIGIPFNSEQIEKYKYKALCIEYSPIKTHEDKAEIDNYKKEMCKQYNVRFIYIVGDHTQSNLFETNGDCIRISTKNHQDEMLAKTVEYILNSLSHRMNEININLSKDNALVYSRNKIEYKKSIAYLYPELAKEWDYEENRRLQPSNVTKGSSLDIHWKCINCGHKWVSKIYRRTAKGYETGCPLCGYHWSDGKIHSPNTVAVAQGVNDLASQYPELVKEWHPTLNEIKPTEVKNGTNKKVYWQCPNCNYGANGEWKASINRRTAKGYETVCPKCKYNWSKHF